MIIRATQKKMMSKPVTSTDDGQERFELAASAPASRASRTDHSAEREPGVEHVLVAAQRAGSRPCLRARLRLRLGLAARDVDVAGVVVPGGDPVAPPELAARCTSPGCCRIQWK